MHKHSDKPAPVAPMPEHPISASAIFDALTCLPDDFMDAGRTDTPPQQREAF